MPSSRIRPTLCLQCGEPIRQPATGRRREICALRKCERAAAAERQRIRRRRAAGIAVSPFMDSAPPAPRGGRDPLVVRLAKQFAAESFPGVALTAGELQALVEAVQAGAASRFALDRLASGSPPSGSWIRPVEEATRAALTQLLQRVPVEPPSRPIQPEVKEVEDVALDAGLVLDPRTGAWVRRR
jgi:hypothetical protein